MIPEEARPFLQQPLIARLTTIEDSGYPHTVPLWYMLDGEDVVVMTDRTSKKVENAIQNPKGAITIGGEPVQGQGWMLQGSFAVETDTDHAWTERITRHYETPENAQRMIDAWKNDDIVTMRLKVSDVIKVYG